MNKDTARVLKDVMLLGKQRVKGDILSKAEFARIPPPVAQALLSQATLGLSDKSSPTEAETKAEEAVDAARAKAQEAREVVSELNTQLGKAQEHGTTLRTKRPALSLRAAKGGKGARPRLDELRQEAAVNAVEVEDLEDAIEAAKAEVAIADDTVREAELQRRRALAEAVLKRAVDGARRVDAGFKQLATDIGTLK